jgi:secernin
MAADMLVARGPATVDEHTFFGQNRGRPGRCGQPLAWVPGREHVPGETVHTQHADLTQPRQTYTVLGTQPEGAWGFDSGVNEHQLAAGCVPLPFRIAGPESGLTGTDVVRLLLERAKTARQAVDLLTDLVERHGQGGATEGDHGFLVADPTEAFAVETAGPFWVYQEVSQVRAVGNVRVIRQDWNRIAHGLADHVIAEGRWPADGSKIDFAGALSEDLNRHLTALRRWGRATLLLEEQAGHIDGAFFRRVLSDYTEEGGPELDDPARDRGALCQLGVGPGGEATAVSLVAHLRPEADRLPLVWAAFGPPCSSVYFPLFVDGPPPESFTAAAVDRLWDGAPRLSERLLYDPGRWVRARETFGRLQARFESEAEEFAADGAELKRRGAADELRRQAGLLAEHHLELYQAAADDLTRPRRGAVAVGSA